MNINNIIKKLPSDIILRIISYTYNIQDKHLLNDIVNYTETKTCLFDLYHQYWIVQMQEEELQDKNWLINDICAYANNYKATMYGYVDTFYNIFRRNIMLRLKTNEEIDRYVNKLQRRHVNKEINVYLGLFSSKERNDVIAKFTT